MPLDPPREDNASCVHHHTLSDLLLETPLPKSHQHAHTRRKCQVQCCLSFLNGSHVLKICWGIIYTWVVTIEGLLFFSVFGTTCRH